MFCSFYLALAKKSPTIISQNGLSFPENRYKKIGSETKQTALDMINAVEELLKVL
jgi:hypothetical protein